jgi:hypothetical protein
MSVQTREEMKEGKDLGASADAAEQWLPVPGYEGLYEISDQGRVKSHHTINRGHILAGSTDRYGYPQVQLSRGGVKLQHKVHRLVCRAFHGEPGSADLHAAHLDGDKTNARATNLCWATRQENEAHKVVHRASREGASPPSGSVPTGAWTPGPWVARRCGAIYPHRWNVIHKIPTPEGGIQRVRTIDQVLDYDGPAEAEANARLIAAAPDLLEALAATVAYSDKFRGGERPDAPGAGEVYDQCRAALAKALGQSALPAPPESESN